MCNLIIKEKVIIDLCFNLSQKLEKIDEEKIDEKQLLVKFSNHVNRLKEVHPNVKWRVHNGDDFYFHADYRRDLNYNGCVDNDYVIWGESDALLPEQAFEVLDNIKNYATQNNVNKYVVTFALRKMWDDSWKTLEHNEFTDSPFYELDDPRSKTEQCSIRYTMSNDEMNEINNRAEELDIRILQQPQFDGSILVLSSDLLKNGVNVPRCILGHAVDDTSMMHSCRQIMGESYVQFVVKNILKVHNRNHPKKRNYCLQMDSDEICTQEKGPNQRGNWYETLKKLANINLSNFGSSQNRFNTYEDFNQIMEKK